MGSKPPPTGGRLFSLVFTFSQKELTKTVDSHKLLRMQATVNTRALHSSTYRDSAGLEQEALEQRVFRSADGLMVATRMWKADPHFAPVADVKRLNVHDTRTISGHKTN